MNNLKAFRKSHIAFLLTIFIMFMSCSDNQLTDDELEQNYDITSFANNHLNIATEFSSLIQSETDINYDIFLDMSTSIDRDEFKSILKDASFNNPEKITSLIDEMSLNAQKFLKNNPEFINLNEKQVRDIFETEFDSQIINNFSVQKAGSCEDTRDTAEYRCERNWFISMGSIAVLTVATGGTAYIATTVATGIFAICMNDAKSDYEACLIQ